jgi:Ser/Thr protein kinase RdoA (MazF antagonist)
MGDESEMTAKLIAETANLCGLSSVEDWRWIKEGESPAVAELRAGGHRYVARIFSNETDVHRAAYIDELLLHLALHRVDAEEVVPTTSSEPVSHLTNGATVILSPYYSAPPVPVPFDEEDARAWGRYVAGLHAACRGRRPKYGLLTPWLRNDPATVGERALSITASFPMAHGALEDASKRIIGCWDGALATHTVHCDLWPANLLKGPHGLRAIDFAEAGVGPRIIDLAMAFRWMPWREDREGSSQLWATWLAGYLQDREMTDVELVAIPAVACLQQLVWMIKEVCSSQDSSTIAWYVEDHCSAIQALV